MSAAVAWSERKIRAVGDVRHWKANRETIEAKRAAAVGAGEILRWYSRGAPDVSAPLTEDALRAAGVADVLAPATGKTRRALLRLLCFVVAAWSDGGRPLVGTRANLSRLINMPDRTLRWWLVRLMDAGVLLVDRDFVANAAGASWGHSQRPNLLSPGMWLRAAARSSGIEATPRQRADRNGWVAFYRRRFDGRREAVEREIATLPDGAAVASKVVEDPFRAAGNATATTGFEVASTTAATTPHDGDGDAATTVDGARDDSGDAATTIARLERRASDGRNGWEASLLRLIRRSEVAT